VSRRAPAAVSQRPPGAQRRLRTAEILAVGSELTNGETRDTNGGELAGWLAGAGVLVEGIVSLPDDARLVSDALRRALGRVDLVVTTGGLGPTPDDLTREAIASVVGEQPEVDPELEAWLRAIFERRGIPFPELNGKQAWLIPSATPIPNERGTAPGWWVDRPDGRVLVALPGPPREMRPLWHEWVRPRLEQRGLGDGRVVRTLRTTGIGESQVVERLGEALLRGANPVVATYARADAVDVRVSAVAEASPTGHGARTAAGIVDATVAAVRAALGGHIWAEGETTWAEALTAALAARGWTLATEEVGTQGALVALLAEAAGVRSERVLAANMTDDPAEDLQERARAVAAAAGADVGLVLVAVPAGRDTIARIAVATPGGTSRAERLLFLGGTAGRIRAGIAAAAVLLEALAWAPDAAPPRPEPERPSLS
jgi:nicotinamide-nucleotide amidase